MRVGHREDDDIDIVERGLLVDARDPEFVLQTGPAGLAQLDVANVIFARLQIPRQACAHLSTRAQQIGRASCRERGCQSVLISAVAGLLKTQKHKKYNKM